MTDNAKDTRPLSLIRAFKQYSDDQWGYHMIDDMTVLERKNFAAFQDWSNSQARYVLVTVYDFNKFETTSFMQKFDTDAAPSAPVVKNFTQVEGKQSIRDAHRALVDLGGHPPPLDEIMGYLTEIEKNVSISAPLKFRQRTEGPGNG